MYTYSRCILTNFSYFFQLMFLFPFLYSSILPVILAYHGRIVKIMCCHIFGRYYTYRTCNVMNLDFSYQHLSHTTSIHVLYAITVPSVYTELTPKLMTTERLLYMYMNWLYYRALVWRSRGCWLNSQPGALKLNFS